MLQDSLPVHEPLYQYIGLYSKSYNLSSLQHVVNIYIYPDYYVHWGFIKRLQAHSVCPEWFYGVANFVNSLGVLDYMCSCFDCIVKSVHMIGINICQNRNFHNVHEFDPKTR